MFFSSHFCYIVLPPDGGLWLGALALEYAYYAIRLELTPRQPHGQGLPLCCAELHLRLRAIGPVQAALVQAPAAHPQPKAVMHQYFHAASTLIGKGISRVRLCRTKGGNDLR